MRKTFITLGFAASILAFSCNRDTAGARGEDTQDGISRNRSLTCPGEDSEAQKEGGNTSDGFEEPEELD